MVKKRKEVEASVPARIKSSGLVARTSIVMLQKSVGDDWSRIGSANALQKERSRRVNGDLAQNEGRGVKPTASITGETESRVGLPLKTGEDRHKAQDGARVSFSGSFIAKSGARVAGPGL